MTDGEVIVRCSPAASVTLYSGRSRGARVNAGRLGYPNNAEVLERDDDGLITSVRLERPCRAAVRPGRGARPPTGRAPGRTHCGSRSSPRAARAARRFDLLVVGGGIIGAGIAEAATAHGLAVALVDRGDFASATSTASSKLIHGGLRYLRLGDVGLVREAHHERRALTNVVAPHLVHRLPFLFPLYEDGPYRPWFVQSGILPTRCSPTRACTVV